MKRRASQAFMVFPIEIWSCIHALLEWQDALRMRQVCSAWYVALEDVPMALFGRLFYYACKGHPHYLQRLLVSHTNRYYIHHHIQDAFMSCLRQGQTSTALVLLQDPFHRIDPSLNSSHALLMAILLRHVGLVKCLLSFPTLQPHSHVIRYIKSELGPSSSAEFIMTLLSDDRVDVTAENQVCLRKCALYNHPSVVRYLLGQPGVDPSAHNNEALRVAAEKGHLAIVKQLVKDHRVDPSALHNEALVLASQQGHPAIVEILLQDPRVDPCDRHNAALRLSMENGYASIVQTLFYHHRMQLDVYGHDLLVWALTKRYSSLVRLIIQDGRFTSLSSSILLHMLQQNEDSLASWTCVHYLHKIQDWALDGAAIFLQACDGGYDDILVQLLKHASLLLTPHVMGMALVSACRLGHARIVDLLLQDSRVDPTLHDNMAVRAASEYGHSDCLKLLLSVPSVDPSAKDQEAIRKAARHAYPSTLSLLLSHPLVDPSANNNEALRIACKYGCTRSVFVLLGDARVDPSANENEAIRVASQGICADIVAMLLRDPRVDPSAKENEAVECAKRRGQTTIIDMLMADPRVSRQDKLKSNRPLSSSRLVYTPNLKNKDVQSHKHTTDILSHILSHPRTLSSLNTLFISE